MFYITLAVIAVLAVHSKFSKKGKVIVVELDYRKLGQRILKIRNKLKGDEKE